MIKAVFFDIDGTLVSFKTHEVPPSAKEALKQLKQRDVFMFAATGRGPDGLAVLKGLPFDGFITLNGQYNYKADGTLVSESVIPRKDLLILLEQITADPVPCGFVRKNDKVFNFRNGLVDEVHAMTGNDDHPAGDISRIDEDKVYQVMVFMDQNRQKELLARLPGCEGARWYPTFFDLSAKSGGKAKGMDDFGKAFGFTPEETMAMGDGGNDLPMLEHAGVAVAMANGDPELKKIAAYVTDDVEADGVAKALRHYGLI